MEPSITTTRSRRLRRTNVALATVLACFLSVTAFAKKTEEEKAAKAAAAQDEDAGRIGCRVRSSSPGEEERTQCVAGEGDRGLADAREEAHRVMLVEAADG